MRFVMTTPYAFGVRLRLDPFIVALLATVGIASLVPASGGWLDGLMLASKAGVGLLFFMYGARLSGGEALDGLRHWRLHTVILATTYVLFPALGVLTTLLPPAVISENLAHGVLLLCLVPGTVQSAVAFTSIAHGNIAGAVVSSTLSNMLGVFLTPLLVAMLLRSAGGAHVDTGAVVAIALQLCAPFVLGQISRRWIGGWIDRHKSIQSYDRAIILLIVYVAFSEGVTQHVWQHVRASQLLVLAVLCCLLLGVILAVTWWGTKVLGFARADRITVMFCGSKKSLTSGLPMASVMFPAASVAIIVLPLMLFHQVQLIVCAWLAGRIGRQEARK